MATINDYLQPGSYSTIIPNPTVPTAGGIPVVAIVGQALQGPYTPQIFLNINDAVTTYGTVTKANPLALGMSLAFQNGAPRVLGVNVEPDNSTPGYMLIPFSTLPTTGYLPAPPYAIDALTELPINTNGAIAGSFYIQDFNPVIPDPVENSSPAAIQQAFANTTSLYQYYGDQFGMTVVPLENTVQQQIIVYSTETSNPPIPIAGGTATITPAQWNQYMNGYSLLNAFNGSFLSPVAASIVVPDSGQTGYNPLPGYRELYSCVGQTIVPPSGSPFTCANITQATNYACTGTPSGSGTWAPGAGGAVYVYLLEPGTQHAVVFGLFDSNTASNSSTQGISFNMPVNYNAGNPFGILQNGTDGVVTTNSYYKAINLLGGQRADIIVVLNTDPGLQPFLLAHVTLQSSTPYRNERIALLSGPITELYQTTIQNVQALQGSVGTQRMMYYFPTAAYLYDAVLRTTVAVDGTYLACACAGIMASHDAAEPLTHKVLQGFRDIALKLDNPTANLIACNGICIIENNPTYGIRVRDQLTCDPTSPETQEISVVRQIDYTAQVLRDVMDANIIATKIVASTLGVVTTLCTTALQNLVNTSIIYGFKGLVARINPNEPREIDVLVSVRPSYPCKWVMIQISITSSLDGF